MGLGKYGQEQRDSAAHVIQIFILEGIVTLIVAFIAFFVMSDYPSTAKFLSQQERDEVSRRLEKDRSSLADEFDMRYFWAAVKDWKIWVHMFITIGSVLLVVGANDCC